MSAPAARSAAPAAAPPPLRVAGLIALAMAIGCPSTPTQFGAPCASAADCAGLICVDDTCIPSRAEGALGESCAAPIPLRKDGDAWAGATTIGDARHDVALGCGDAAPDIVFSMRLGEPSALRVVVDAPFPVTIGVRDSACLEGREEIPDGCAAASELVLPYVAPGDWNVIVSGVPANGDGVVVRVEPLPCPLGYLPLPTRGGASTEAPRCAGFRAVMPLNAPRNDFTLTPLDDGRAIVVGGTDLSRKPLLAAEVFDPMTRAWSFIEFDEYHEAHAALSLPGDDGQPSSVLVLGGGPRIEIFQPAFPGGVDNVISAPVDHAVGGPITAALLPDGRVFALVDETPFLGNITTRVVTCARNVDCGAGRICLGAADTDDNQIIDQFGVCVCNQTTCAPNHNFRLSADPYLPGDRTSLPQRAPLALLSRATLEPHVALHDLSGVLHLFDVRALVWRAQSVMRREQPRLTALDDRRLLMVGGDVDNRSTGAVEIFDVVRQGEAGAVVALPDIPARQRHAQLLIDDELVLIAGGNDNGVARDDAFLLDTVSGERIRLPRMPAALADAEAALLADGSVLIVGDEASMIFEIRADPTEPVPDSGRTICDDAVPLPIGETIFESTRGAADRVRAASCSDSRLTAGPERIFAVDLPPGNHRLDLAIEERDLSTSATFSVSMFSGKCDARVELGCDEMFTSETGLVSITAPSVEGNRTMYIVVEAQPLSGESAAVADGVAFSIALSLSASEACAPGPEDHPEESITNAPPLARVEPDDPSYLAFLEQRGELCPGDVDYTLIANHGLAPGMDLYLSGAPHAQASIHRVIVDENASAALGRPVYTTGASFPFDTAALADEPAGLYVVEVRGVPQSIVRTSWQLTVGGFACTPDEEDAFVATLDDAANPAFRRLLAPATLIERCAAYVGDVDVTVLVLPPDRPAIVHSEAPATLHRLDSEDAPLGEPLDVVQDDDGDFHLAPGQGAPYLAVRSVGDPGYDYLVTYDVVPDGDVCSTALPLQKQGSVRVSSAAFSNDLDAATVGDCTGYRSPGEDAFFVVAIAPGETLTASVVPASNDHDVAIYVMDTCSADATCLVGEDDGGGGVTDAIAYTHAGAAGEVFIVVDSYYGDPFVADLVWSVSP